MSNNSRNTITVSNNINIKTFFSIMYTFILLFVLIFIIYKINTNELFATSPDTSPDTSPNTSPDPIERTKLYGSLFLNSLSEQVINMTDPPINYDSKRIEIFRYSDILL